MSGEEPLSEEGCANIDTEEMARNRVLILSPLKTEMASRVLILSPLKSEASRTRTAVLSSQCCYLYTPELHPQSGYACCFACVCIPSSSHSEMDLSSHAVKLSSLTALGRAYEEGVPELSDQRVLAIFFLN